MDRSAFYNTVRKELFNGVLSQQQVDGMEAILNFWETPPVQPAGQFKVNWDVRAIGWLAYMLATTKHETASTMQPIDEFGDNAYFTGRRNDEQVTPVVQSFFPSAPDFALNPAAVKDDNYAAVIMFYGMFNGIFTGFALKNFIGDPEKGQIVDFLHARKIINGMDRADIIEAYAKKFSIALSNAGAVA
jgi:putative chitinase